MNDFTRHTTKRLLRGALACVLAGATAVSVLGQMPPPGRRPPPAPPSAVTVQGYLIADADVIGVAGKLQEIYAQRPDVKIAGDPRTQQVVVIGPPQVQQEIGGWLAVKRLLPHPQDQGAAPLPAASVEQPQQVFTQAWQLRNLTWKEFESHLLKTWGSKLETSQDAVGDVSNFRFPQTPAGRTSIVVDRRIGRVTVTGPQSSAASWQRVMSVLDSRPKTADERTSIVSLVKADRQTVRRAIDLVGQVVSNFDPRKKHHIGQFVSMIFQPEAGAAAQPGATQPGATQPVATQLPPGGAPLPAGAAESVVVGEAPPGSVAEAVGRLVGNVQIEILDDVVIVVGRAQDVEKVLQIIEQIEQQSIQFRPEVEIYNLQHVNSQSLYETIVQIQGIIFARQGPVTIVPLAKPNALMLIGRKENIPAMVELIQKLDQPSSPESQLKAFPLRFMSAIDAERTIRTFFNDRPGVTTNLRGGLDTRVLIIAEYRSNTLIVQASPRDMREVERLIEALDIEKSPNTQEVKVFKLRSAQAADLAPVLQEAITGIGVGVQQQVQAPVAAGGAGASSPATANRPPINLQFLRVGSDGQQLLQSGILANMRITSDPGANSLIVIGPASAMELMGALIEQLDGLPNVGAQIKVFGIINSDATALSTMLQSLFGQTTQAGAGAAAQAVQQFLSPTGTGATSLVQLRFSVDQRTNSIIASGNPEDLEVVRTIILRLDLPDIMERVNTVVRLNNAPALDVATAINNLLTRQRTLNQAAPQLVTAYQQIEREVLIEPEPITNSLIISATPRYFERIKRILNDLDRRPPMVTIQVVIAEVTLADNEQFGIEWGLQDSLLFDRGIPPAAGGALNPGYAFNSTTLPNQNSASSLATRNNVATQAISNLATGRIDPTLGFGGLVLTASSDSVNVLLRALELSSRMQVISRPTVQTLDNQLAYVNVGSLVPRITSVTQSTVGVANPSVTDISVGIILQVTPRTNPDGTIVMQINATKSAVGPDATGIPIFTDANGNVVRSPQIPLTTAQTTVSARSGQTVILGGLITKNQQETTHRIPYLGDIPALGRLFRFDSISNTRTELLLIMTPYIMQSEEQNEWLNQRESQRMSWCLADLVNIHGPVGMSGNPANNMQEAPTIFPDLTPGGLPPAQSLPAMPNPTPAAPLPGLQLPVQPMSAQPGASEYGPLPSVVIPQPPSLIAPPPGVGTLVPETIMPAAPPAGTQARLPLGPPPAPPQPPLGPPPPMQFSPVVAPAGYQQSMGR